MKWNFLPVSIHPVVINLNVFHAEHKNFRVYSIYFPVVSLLLLAIHSMQFLELFFCFFAMMNASSGCCVVLVGFHEVDMIFIFLLLLLLRWLVLNISWEICCFLHIHKIMTFGVHVVQIFVCFIFQVACSFVQDSI